MLTKLEIALISYTVHRFAIKSSKIAVYKLLMMQKKSIRTQLDVNEGKKLSLILNYSVRIVCIQHIILYRFLYKISHTLEKIA
jgi:hypothetical protein